MTATSIVWFRLDLRLADNPALEAAVRRGAIVPLFVWAPAEEAEWAPGAAARWWLDASLRALARELETHGLVLVVRQGPSAQVIREVATASGATAVFWNRRYEPRVVARDTEIKQALRAQGLIAESFNAALLAEPWDVRNLAGKPFQVFTPFWKRCVAGLGSPRPLPAPAALRPAASPPAREPIDALGLLPRQRWYARMASVWQPGERGARLQLQRFLAQSLAGYDQARDRPDLPATSRLSPHLHFGEISPRQVWDAFAVAASARGLDAADWRGSRFLAELGWREFAHHLLWHFPRTAAEPLRAEFSAFPWKSDARLLEAWERGRTGIPMVDAGMRELWATGWMHNRVRMIVASFLTKNLLQPWQVGARWFWDTLVDADLASNTLGWQWTAGCGADAAPYFRIFNPVSQGAKFDPAGDYVRQWIPELAGIAAPAVHAPWEYDGGPADYPAPVVDLAASRAAALAAYARMRGR